MLYSKRLTSTSSSSLRGISKSAPEELRINIAWKGDQMSKTRQLTEKEKPVLLVENIDGDKHLSLRAALNLSVLEKRFAVGDQVGFKVGRKRFVLYRAD